MDKISYLRNWGRPYGQLFTGDDYRFDFNEREMQFVYGQRHKRDEQGKLVYMEDGYPVYEECDIFLKDFSFKTNPELECFVRYVPSYKLHWQYQDEREGDVIREWEDITHHRERWRPIYYFNDYEMFYGPGMRKRGEIELLWNSFMLDKIVTTDEQREEEYMEKFAQYCQEERDAAMAIGNTARVEQIDLHFKNVAQMLQEKRLARAEALREEKLAELRVQQVGILKERMMAYAARFTGGGDLYNKMVHKDYARWRGNAIEHFLNGTRCPEGLNEYLSFHYGKNHCSEYVYNIRASQEQSLAYIVASGIVPEGQYSIFVPPYVPCVMDDKYVEDYKERHFGKKSGLQVSNGTETYYLSDYCVIDSSGNVDIDASIKWGEYLYSNTEPNNKKMFIQEFSHWWRDYILSHEIENEAEILAADQALAHFETFTKQSEEAVVAGQEGYRQKLLEQIAMLDPENGVIGKNIHNEGWAKSRANELRRFYDSKVRWDQAEFERCRGVEPDSQWVFRIFNTHSANPANEETILQDLANQGVLNINPEEFRLEIPEGATANWWFNQKGFKSGLKVTDGTDTYYLTDDCVVLPNGQIDYEASVAWGKYVYQHVPYPTDYRRSEYEAAFKCGWQLRFVRHAFENEEEMFLFDKVAHKFEVEIEKLQHPERDFVNS